MLVGWDMICLSELANLNQKTQPDETLQMRPARLEVAVEAQERTSIVGRVCCTDRGIVTPATISRRYDHFKMIDYISLVAIVTA